MREVMMCFFFLETLRIKKHSTDYFNLLNFILLFIFFRAKALFCDYFIICLLHYIFFPPVEEQAILSSKIA